MSNYWLDGIMGVVTGDALGDPVQFESREEVAAHPVTEMRGGGAYAMPAGTWTDDSSMTLATMASIAEKHQIDLADIMDRFVAWLENGEYTPFGEAFDEGNGTVKAITRYEKCGDPLTSGGTSEYDNGNGSLMRILPACIYCWEAERKGVLTEALAVTLIHQVSGLTHNHMRAKIGCGLYYFIVKAVLDARVDEVAKDETDGNGSEIGIELQNILQRGLTHGFSYYEGVPEASDDLQFYHRLRNLEEFRQVPMSGIRSSGYVVDTLEAAVWSLLITDSFRKALLAAVNLGDDTDTVGAVAGGLAGLYYGYENISEDWLAVLQRKNDIEKMSKIMWQP